MRFVTFAVAGLGMLCTSISNAQTQTPRSIGHITAAFGEARIESSGPSGGGQSRGADLFSPFSNDERVITKDAGLSLLLKSRIVVKLDAATSVSFSESTGQTNALLEAGTVQVFAGKRPAYAGNASVQDALTRIDGKDAVFLASYDRAARTGYYACEHGTVNIELAADHKRVILNEDQQAIAIEGKPLEIGALDREMFNRHQRSQLRLGQSMIEQGSQTQRGRASALDTSNALAQLEAAGWIDRKTLTVPRPLSQSTSNNTEQAKTSDNQVASSSGSSKSDPTPSASSSSPPPAPVEPAAEAPPARETTTPVAVVDPVIDSIDPPSKAPKIKLPKIEKPERGRGGDDLKIPKLERPKRGGEDFDVKDVQEFIKKIRERVEKSDRGKRGKGDD